jgi:hypothetical protein
MVFFRKRVQKLFFSLKNITMEWILSFWYKQPESLTNAFENQLLEARSKLKKAIINDKDRVFQMNLRQAKSNLKSRELTQTENPVEEHEFLKIKLKPVQDKIPCFIEPKVNPIHQELLKKINT